MSAPSALTVPANAQVVVLRQACWTDTRELLMCRLAVTAGSDEEQFRGVKYSDLSPLAIVNTMSCAERASRLRVCCHGG